MANKKYQVFVSSTFKDLADERQDTIRSILDLNHIPAGMELFPAADIDQLTYIKKVIDECDYYLLIVGGRYGSMDEEGISYTEREYDYAVETDKFVIAFVHSEPEAISVKNSDVKPEAVQALNSFREKVKTGRLVREWKDRQHLEGAVIKSLSMAFNNFPQVGWIRGNAAANEQVLEQSNKALQENAELREQIAKLNTEVTPRFDDLAGLDDEIEVRFRYSHYSNAKTRYYEDSNTFTWRQVFLHLAAQLTTAKVDVAISRAIGSLLKESGYERTYSDMNAMDKTKIKVQLTALGLISLKVAQSTKGAIAEFLSLTKKGSRVFMEGMVVRCEKSV